MPDVDDARVLFTGPAGAGTTTAIRILSANPSDDALSAEEGGPVLQAVPFDHGVFEADDGRRALLYGAPNHLRFDFMWKRLADEAVGMVVLLDHSRPDPAADALRYVQTFGCLARRGVSVGVARFDPRRTPGLDTISFRLRSAGYRATVIEADPRCRADMVRLLQPLLERAQQPPLTWRGGLETDPAPLSN